MSKNVVLFVYVFDSQLDVRHPSKVVLDYGITAVKGVGLLDVVEVGALSEAYCAEADVSLHQFQFQVTAVCSHFAAVSVVVHIFGCEDGSAVAWAEGLELFEYSDEFRGSLVKFQFRVYLHGRGEALHLEFALYGLFHLAYEVFQLFLAQGQPGGE